MRDEHYAGADRLIDIDNLKEKIIDSGRALDVLEHRRIDAAGQTDRDEVLMRNGHRGEANPSCGWNKTKGTFIDRADERHNGSLIDVIAHTDGLSLPDQLPAVCKIIADEVGMELLRMDGTSYDDRGGQTIDPAEHAKAVKAAE